MTLKSFIHIFERIIQPPNDGNVVDTVHQKEQIKDLMQAATVFLES